MTQHNTAAIVVVSIIFMYLVVVMVINEIHCVVKKIQVNLMILFFMKRRPHTGPQGELH